MPDHPYARSYEWTSEGRWLRFSSRTGSEGDIIESFRPSETANFADVVIAYPTTITPQEYIVTVSNWATLHLKRFEPFYTTAGSTATMKFASFSDAGKRTQAEGLRGLKSEKPTEVKATAIADGFAAVSVDIQASRPSIWRFELEVDLGEGPQPQVRSVIGSVDGMKTVGKNLIMGAWLHRGRPLRPSQSPTPNQPPGATELGLLLSLPSMMEHRGQLAKLLSLHGANIGEPAASAIVEDLIGTFRVPHGA